MYGTKAHELFDLLKARGIVGAQGTVNVELLGTKVIINDKGATGNLIQEWLGQWMDLNGFYRRGNPNTQKFPDFYLSEAEDVDLLEVKTFDYGKSPNFDVAQFDAYVRSIRKDAYRLDADYLILGYSLSNGIIQINGIWLKKIWELCCASTEYAIRTNVKQAKIHNIRPYNFKSMSAGFRPFASRPVFLNAIRDTLEKYLQNKEYADQWLEEVEQSYAAFATAQPE